MTPINFKCIVASCGRASEPRHAVCVVHLLLQGLVVALGGLILVAALILGVRWAAR